MENLRKGGAPTPEQPVRAPEYGLAASRAGLLMQITGAGLLALLFPLEHPFFTAGILVFEAGALLSAFRMIARRDPMRFIPSGAVLTGIIVQIFGLYAAPAEHAIMVTLAGVGLAGGGAALMAGITATGASAREGWMLAALYPVLVIANLSGRASFLFNTIGFSLHFLLLVALQGRLSRQGADGNRAAGLH